MEPTLDIIIVNWNTGRALRNCLNSIAKCRRETFALTQVIVVDNASTDDSAEGLEEKEIPLVLLKNGMNQGFAAACNQGASRSFSDYLLFLNPDTILFPNSLQIAVDFQEMRENLACGICGGFALDENGHPAVSAARFPTLRIFFWKMTGLSVLFPNWFPSHFMTPEECQKNRAVDQVIGAFFLIRGDLYRKLGGFDERFFLYFEEVDLSLRARRLGYCSFLVTECRYIHEGCKSSNQVLGKRLYYSLNSRLLYAFKHYSRASAWSLMMLTFSLEFAIRLFVTLLKLSPQQFGHVLKGYLLTAHSMLRKGFFR